MPDEDKPPQVPTEQSTKGFTGLFTKMETRDARQDERTDRAWQTALDAQVKTNRFQWLVILFLVVGLLIMAGREVGIDILGLGKMGSKTTTEEPAP